MPIDNNLKKCRIERNMTQEELAKKIKYSRSYIARVEIGQQLPSLPFIKACAKVLDKKLDELVR